MSSFLLWVGRISAAILVIGCIALAGARGLKIAVGPFAYLVPLIPYTIFVLVLAVVLAITTRWWPLAIIAALPLVLVTYWWLPPFVNSPAPGEPALVVATSNLALGEGDAQAVVAMVKQEHVGLLAVEELTPTAMARLTAAGVGRLLPHSYVEPRRGASGTGMFSRYPISQAHGNQTTALANLEARVELPRGQRATWLAVHVAGIVPGQHELWSAEATELAKHVSAMSGPVILSGDFNATRDQPLILDLEAAGYADAPTAAGSGFVRTFPSSWPLVGIDHVLTRNLGLHAISTAVVSIPRSDHRAFLATYG